MKIIFVSLVLCLSTGYAQYPAGHIPVSDRQEWNKAGLQKKDIPNVVERVINFKTEFTAIEENDDKIVHILDGLSGDKLTIIYFPEGEYIFYAPIIINKNNVVLLGQGADKTKLFFENAKTDPCILIAGYGFNTKYDINGPVYKDNNIISADAVPYLNDQWVYFHEQKSGYGQITKISTYGDIPILDLLELKDKTTKDYTTDDLQIALFAPRMNVGIENMMIKKNTNGKGEGGISIYFNKAVNCWVKGIESAYTSQHHIAMVNSSHIEVTGNYLHHAQYYGEGGFGYGVIVHHNSTNCLVENNILKHLRHSIALQKGANCNVIAYNYSYDRRSYNDDIFSPEDQSCDLVLHGNYTWGNLFEENNVAAIAADNTHGKNGPYNAFVRNRSRADGIIALQPGWYPLEYGLVLYKAPLTSLLGNLISNNDVKYSASDLSVNIFGRAVGEGDYDNWSNIGHRGSTYRKAKNNPNSYFLYDESYYYDERPDFLDDEYTYPSMGPKTMSGIELTQNIPAHGRVNNNLILTVNTSPTASPPW